MLPGHRLRQDARGLGLDVVLTEVEERQLFLLREELAEPALVDETPGDEDLAEAAAVRPRLEQRLLNVGRRGEPEQNDEGAERELAGVVCCRCHEHYVGGGARAVDPPVG